jgi:Avidin family
MPSSPPYRSLLLLATLSASAALAAEPAASPTCSRPTGAWTTNLGATVRIDRIDGESGRIEGSYRPASVKDRTFPLTGFVNAATEGDRREGHTAVAVSFAVSFAEYGGITAWSGVCLEEDGEVRIETEDLIVRPTAEAAWAHVVANHDTLVPVAGATPAP